MLVGIYKITRIEDAQPFYSISEPKPLADSIVDMPEDKIAWIEGVYKELYEVSDYIEELIK